MLKTMKDGIAYNTGLIDGYTKTEIDKKFLDYENILSDLTFAHRLYVKYWRDIDVTDSGSLDYRVGRMCIIRIWCTLNEDTTDFTPIGTVVSQNINENDITDTSPFMSFNQIYFLKMEL